MAWIMQAGGGAPDGTPFEPPTDSFERTYNHRLRLDGAEAVNGAVLEPSEGYPLGLRNFLDKPASRDELVGTLAMFFEPGYQHMCSAAGNTPGELDTLAKRLLTFAAMLDAPVTDRERVIAARLGVDLDACPRRTEDSPPIY